MRIWIIDHYSVPIEYYPLARNTNFAKHLIKKGYEVIIFAASTVHNSKVNLIEDDKPYKEVNDNGVNYVLINCHQYSGNGLKRILNMYEFAGKLETVCNHYPKPDAIIATSMTLQACKKGIMIGREYGCKCIAQITDLWPETLIAYGRATKHHPIVLWFRRIEKWIYQHADKIIFSMEGAYDYIIEQGWTKEIPRSKVFFINNGVELEEFEYNKEHYIIEDEDLTDPNLFRVIYTGSVREVNNIGKLIVVAKNVKDKRIKFLVWGDGNQKDELEKRLKEEQIANFVFKGKVDKRYIPYITSCADLNIAHNTSSPLFRFGISFNKIFDYMAAGKPIICDFECKYNPVITHGAGIEIASGNEVEIAKEIERLCSDSNTRDMCSNALRAIREEYNFSHLTEKLERVITASTEGS